LRERLWLVKNGIPYDVAMCLSQHEAAGYSIIFCELKLPDNEHFDFDLMRYKEPPNA